MKKFIDHQIDDFFDGMNEGLSLVNSMTATYDKQPGLLKAVGIDILVPSDEFEASETNVEEMNLKIQVTISGHNETQTWELPKEALEAPVQTILICLNQTNIFRPFS